MKLELYQRDASSKGKTNQLRREGNIPAVLYGPQREAKTCSVKADAFAAVIRSLKPGLLATQVFELTMDGKTIKAIIKDVQYHVANYEVRHLDFLELGKEAKVTLNVPIKIEGVAECAGVKLGGSLRQVIRFLKVRCFPDKIPEMFSFDVKGLALGGVMKLSDLQIPEGIEPRAVMNQVAVLVSGGKKLGA